MQAVAAEPAVALEALPPATFDCIGLHHKEEKYLKNVFSSTTYREEQGGE